MKKFIGSLFIFIILLHTAVFADNYNDEIWQDLAYEREMNFSKLANLDESDVQIFKYEKTEEDSKKDENWQSGHIIMKTRLSAYGTFSLFNEILNKSCYNPMNNKNYNYNNYRKRISTFFRRVDLKGENAVGYYRVSFKGNSKKNGTENSYNTFEDYVIARQDKNIEDESVKVYYGAEFERKPYENFIDTKIGNSKLNINGTEFDTKLPATMYNGDIYLPEDGARSIFLYFDQNAEVDSLISQRKYIIVYGKKYFEFANIISTLKKGKNKVFFDKDTGIASACMIDFPNDKNTK
jgi:hypothetical protein